VIKSWSELFKSWCDPSQKTTEDFKLIAPLTEIRYEPIDRPSDRDTMQLNKPSKDKIRLLASGVYVFIENFAKKYHKFFYRNEINSGSSSFNTEEIDNEGLWRDSIKFIQEYNKKKEEGLREKSAMNNELTTLQKLLKSKEFTFSINELHLLLSEAAKNQEYKDFEKKILFNSPTKLEDYVINLLDAYGERHKAYLEFLQFLMDLRGIKVGINEIIGKVDEATELLKLRSFENKFGLNGINITSLGEINSMTGYEFEELLKQLFERMGFAVEQTKLSGDQGADLVVKKLGETTVIQAKRSNSKIGNDAVQEVVAARGHYNAQKGIVMSNNYFTPAAKELAKSNKITLIDRDGIKELIGKYL